MDCVVEDARWAEIGIETLAANAQAKTLSALGLDGFEATLLACDDTRIAALNGDFRAKPTPTNVLSWPSQERGADQPGRAPIAPDPNDPELGDIAIAFDTCQREATTQGKDFADHTSHLLVHGLLHLLGYDHETDKDAALMENLEIKILATMGLGDPYDV